MFLVGSVNQLKCNHLIPLAVIAVDGLGGDIIVVAME